MAKTQTVDTTTSALNSSVKIVGDKLILSLPDSKEPVVWQMSLEQAGTAAFSVKEDSADKSYNLVLKSQDGASTNIAPFEDKSGAMAVLMEISQVLQSKQALRYMGANVSGKVGKVKGKPSGKSDKLGAILAILLSIVLIFIWFVSASASRNLGTSSSVQDEVSYGAGSTVSRDSSGVAVSADDFLSNR